MSDLGSLATAAGVAAVVVAVLAVLMPVLNLSTEASNRFGPLLAVIVGVVVALVAAILGIGADPTADFGTRIFAAILVGLFAGLEAVGIHQGVKKTILGQPSS